MTNPTSAKGVVLLTGAAGFIGRRIGQALTARGWRVIGTDVAVADDPGFAVHRADVRDTVRHAGLLAEGCDGIIHAGGVSGPMVMSDNPAEVMDVNFRGTTSLLALARAFGLRRFVGLSSVSAYGTTTGLDVVDETAPLIATNAYGTSKAASDLAIQSYAGTYGLDAVALRIGWVYGPGRVTDAIIQPALRSARGGPAFEMAEGGDHMIQFVHVDDVVEAVLATYLAERPSFAAYNVNGAEAHSVRDICALIATQRPDVKLRLGSGTIPGGEVQGRMDLSRIETDLGWQPRIGFAQGLRDYVDWLSEHPV